MTAVTSDNRYGTAQLIVAPTLAQGANYTTIGAALTAAVSGQTIFIRPGTYTENLTLKAGVNICAYDCDAYTPNVTIVGKATFTAAGTVSISGIRLQTNSDFLLAITGSAASNVNIVNCYLNCTNNTGISMTSSGAGQLLIHGTDLVLGTTGIGYFAISGTNSSRFEYCFFSNAGLSSTASTLANTGTNLFFYCIVDGPISTSGTATNMDANNSTFSGQTVNATGLTMNSTTATTQIFSECFFDGGTASAISVGAGAQMTIVNGEVGSTNTNAITGSGTINYQGVSFFRSSSTINTTTQVPKTFTAVQGGVDQGTFTPALAFGGGTTGITYSSQLGSYVRTGNAVMIFINLTLTNKGSSTGAATITGLPVATLGSATITKAVPVGNWQSVTLTALYTAVSASVVGASSTSMSLIQCGSAQVTAVLTDTNFANTSAIQISGVYSIA